MVATLIKFIHIFWPMHVLDAAARHRKITVVEKDDCGMITDTSYLGSRCGKASMSSNDAQTHQTVCIGNTVVHQRMETYASCILRFFRDMGRARPFAMISKDHHRPSHQQTNQK
jgi:hypothetical protein